MNSTCDESKHQTGMNRDGKHCGLLGEELTFVCNARRVMATASCGSMCRINSATGREMAPQRQTTFIGNAPQSDVTDHLMR